MCNYCYAAVSVFFPHLRLGTMHTSNYGLGFIDIYSNSLMKGLLQLCQSVTLIYRYGIFFYMCEHSSYGMLSRLEHSEAMM